MPPAEYILLNPNSSCGGPKEKGFLGRSAVAAPFKGLVGRTQSCEAEVKVVEVDLDVIKVSLADSILGFVHV